MTEIVFKNTESKLIPLEIIENLPRNSLRFLINPEFIHEKRKEWNFHIWKFHIWKFLMQNVSCWFFMNSFSWIEGLRLWEAAWRTDCLKKRKGGTATKQPRNPWPSPVALSYIYPWEYAETAEIIFTRCRWPYHLLWRWPNSKSKQVMG